MYQDQVFTDSEIFDASSLPLEISAPGGSVPSTYYQRVTGSMDRAEAEVDRKKVILVNEMTDFDVLDVDGNYEAEIASDSESEPGVDDVDTDDYSETEVLDDDDYSEDDYIEDEGLDDVDDYKDEEVENDESEVEGNISEEVLDKKAVEKLPTVRRGPPNVAMQNIFYMPPSALFKLTETRTSASADTIIVARLCFSQSEALFQVRYPSTDIFA